MQYAHAASIYAAEKIANYAKSLVFALRFCYNG